MKAVMVMYDSLRRMDLPSYGGKEIELPNFKRLAEHTVVFDNSYVCSMPCMPARREIHTGRANFLHRSWGPLEPFDDSMPEILKDPPPVVQLDSFGDSGIKYVIRAWCSNADFGTVRFGLNEKLYAAFRSHGVTMTYPHLNVHFPDAPERSR